MLDTLRSSSDEEPHEMCERIGMTEDTVAPAPDEPPDQEDPRRPVAIVHYVEWRRASSTELPLNGVVPPRLWGVRNVIGEVMIPGTTKTAAINSMSAIDFFLFMFPPKQLITMVDLTNAELSKSALNATNSSEMLKFFGILIQMTSFEFTSRASLWSSVAPMKYRPAPHFGLTGMSKHRFDDSISRG